MKPTAALIDSRTPEESQFYITFGVKYRHEVHPAGMHPDGYAIIVAADEMAARLKANEVFGQEHWAFIYDHQDRQVPERFKEQSYPLGCLGVFYA